MTEAQICPLFPLSECVVQASDLKHRLHTLPPSSQTQPLTVLSNALHQGHGVMCINTAKAPKLPVIKSWSPPACFHTHSAQSASGNPTLTSILPRHRPFPPAHSREPELSLIVSTAVLPLLLHLLPLSHPQHGCWLCPHSLT